MELVAEEEVVIPVDGAAEGVFNGENGPIGDPEFNSLESDLKLVAGDGVAVGVSFSGGGFGVGTGNALVSNAESGAVHRSGGEVGDGEGLGKSLESVGVGISGDGDEIEILKAGGGVAVERRG